MKKLLITTAMIVCATNAFASDNKENIVVTTVNGFTIECYTDMMSELKWCSLSSGYLNESIRIMKNVYRDNDYCIDIVGHNFPGRVIGQVRVGSDSIFLHSGEPIAGMPVACQASMTDTSIFERSNTIKVSYANWPSGTYYDEYSIEGIQQALSVLETMTKEYKNN